MESGRAVPIKGVSEFLAFLKESDILSAVAAGSTVRHYERIQQNPQSGRN
jgi:beta-phosphoglucomutase-like phosphatase (HAD superfamily)